MYILSPLVGPGYTHIRFYAIWCSNVALAAGKNKSRPKSFQLPKNTKLSLSETDSFDKILWHRE